MRVEDEIRDRLQAVFSPQHLEIIDESELHRGHAGYQEGGQSHFQVNISAESFGAMTRIARHRAIHDALGPELIGRIHALALKVEA